MAHDFSAKPASHGDAARKNKTGADARLGVEKGKHATATDDAGADRSARNAQRAKSRTWTAGSQDDRSANASGRGQRREN